MTRASQGTREDILMVARGERVTKQIRYLGKDKRFPEGVTNNTLSSREGASKPRVELTHGILVGGSLRSEGSTMRMADKVFRQSRVLL